ncbi:MAG: hypothetical protein SOW66_02175 [Porphyromonas sp.]|nr:hypothetical protein [Porphyromonas sp.]
MDSTIQALTEKVYNEGVLKGTAEAERLMAEAEARIAAREAEAKQKAEEIILAAQRGAEELKQNTQRELQLYAAQLVEATRSTLATELTGTIASENVKALSVNPEFIQAAVLELVKGFDLNRGVEISGADADKLSAYFASNAKALLEQGVSIKSVSGKPADFTLRPSDGSFKLHIGEAEFLELFKSFLRPQLAAQLF